MPIGVCDSISEIDEDIVQYTNQKYKNNIKDNSKKKYVKHYNKNPYGDYKTDLIKCSDKDSEDEYDYNI